MIRPLLTVMGLFCATSLAAQDVTILNAHVSAAPPGVMSHAAYLELTNKSARTRSLIGLTARGYGMAHLHESKEQDGIVVMSMVHQLDIEPGQTVSLKPGRLHIMLMGPKGQKATGETITLTLHFANGQDIVAEAVIKPRDAGS